MAFPVGRIAFINVAPIFYALEHGHIPNPYHFVYDTPARLNAMMHKGELCLAACSSVEYAKNSASYVLDPHLCIASKGPVQSVLLFSHQPIERLEGTITITAQSNTSVILTKLLLAKYFKRTVSYCQGSVDQAQTAYLAIGDEALRLSKQGLFPYCLDTATAWRMWTKTPFVFALFILQKNWSSPDATKPLQESLAWGMEHLPDVIASVRNTCPLTDEELSFYYQHALTYSLGCDERKGLRLFFTMAADEGLLPNVPDLLFA